MNPGSSLRLQKYKTILRVSEAQPTTKQVNQINNAVDTQVIEGGEELLGDEGT